MKTPRIALPAPLRFALAALIAVCALAPEASAQFKENPDSAGYVQASACIQCHSKTVFPNGTKSHAGYKVCLPPSRWISGSPGYCCGGTTASHCPDDGFPSKKTNSPFEPYPIDRTALEQYLKTMPRYGATGTTGKTGATGASGKTGATGKGGGTTPKKKKPAVVVAYWCDPAGKVVAVPPGKAPAGGTKMPKKDSPCVVAKAGTGTGAVVVSTPTPVLVALPLIDADRLETRWLTKAQIPEYGDDRTAAKDDAAKKVVDDKYRGIIKATIRPEVAGAYAAAYALSPASAPAAIKAAIGSVEMWGGKGIAAIVAPYQPKDTKADAATAKLLEIQLSEADWNLLNSPPAPKDKPKGKTKGKGAAPTNPTAVTEAAKKYIVDRLGADGKGDGAAFKESAFDPIRLRLSVVAALTKLGKAPAAYVEKPTGDATAGGPLTAAELAVLTPEERKNYDAIVASAKGNLQDPNVLALAKDLRAKIAAEDRLNPKYTPLPSDLSKMTEAEFQALPPFQKKQFCVNYPPDGSAVAGDSKAAELDTSPDALTGAKNSAKNPVTKPKAGTSATADTSPFTKKQRQDACSKSAAPGQIDAGAGLKPNLTASVPEIEPGQDKEIPEKEKSKWLTEPLVISAVTGSLFGLLIGSLFGPVGLILGPIIGAVAFYGISKLKE